MDISMHKMRIQKLLHKMHAQSCEACLIQNPVDLFYLTGIQLSAGKLCVHAQETILFVDGRYLQAAQEKAPMKVCLDEKDAMLAFLHAHKCKSVWFDGQHTSYEAYLKWKQMLKGIEFISNASFFKTLRVLKDHEEIDKMKKSASLLWQGFQYIRSKLQEGITEREISKSFEIFCLEKGGEGLAFEPIIAFGPHSALPHYRSKHETLQSGDIVLIDIGVIVEQYHSDMTRVLFFGPTNPDLETLYRINKAAHDAALKVCRPGIPISIVDRAARDVMIEHHVEHLFVHSLGHGIGLETHEFPRIKWDGEDKDVLLEPGMIFTIEPGLYMPGKGGVRYEDTILITKTGYENFFPDGI